MGFYDDFSICSKKISFNNIQFSIIFDNIFQFDIIFGIWT